MLNDNAKAVIDKLQYIIDRFVKVKFYPTPRKIVNEPHVIEKQSDDTYISFFGEIVSDKEKYEVRVFKETTLEQSFPDFNEYTLVKNMPTKANECYVDRENNLIYFHSSQDTSEISITYYSIGIGMLSSALVYTHFDSNNKVIETLYSLTKKCQEELDRISTVTNAEQLRVELQSYIESLLELIRLYPNPGVVVAELTNLINQANESSLDLKTSIGEAERFLTEIKTGSNRFVEILPSSWEKTESGRYKFEYYHNLNTKNLVINTTEIINGIETNSQIDYEKPNDNKIIFYTSDNTIRAKAIMSASYYPGILGDKEIGVISADNLEDGVDKVVMTREDREAIKNYGKIINNHSSQLEQKTDKSTTQNIQAQINNLVLNGDGTQNLEVVQARVDINGNAFNTLKMRNDNIERILNENRTQITFNDWEKGNIIEGNNVETSVYIRTNRFYRFDLDSKIYINMPNDYYLKVIFYNEDKTYYHSNETTNVNEITVIAPYVRFSIRKEGYAEIDIDDNVNVLFFKDFEFNLPYLNEEKLFEIKKINLVDKMFKGYLSTSTGELRPNSNWSTTDFIKFKTGEILNTNLSTKFSGELTYKVFVFNNSNVFEKTIATKSFPIKIEEDCYIRLCINKSDVNYNNFKIQKNDILSDLNEKKYITGLYVKKENVDGINNIESKTESLLKGLKIGALGDSYTSNKDSDNWLEKIAKRTECLPFNYGQGGSRVCMDYSWTGSSGLVETQSFIKRLNNMPTDLDIVIAFGGINDSFATASIKLGTIDDEMAENSTFYGGFKKLVYDLITKYYDKDVLVIIPPKIYGGTRLTNEFVPAMKNVCKMYSIPYLDLDEEFQFSSLHPARYTNYHLSETDIHLNTKGKEKLSYIIEKFIINNICR